MALIEDMLKGNLLLAAGIGTTALVLPKVLPALPPAMRTAVKGGLSLFSASESEAEGGIIDRLDDNALKYALQGLSGSGSDAERHAAAQGAVDEFKRKAGARAGRYAHSESNRSARYHRHIAALRHAITREQSRRRDTHGAALGRLLDHLDKA